MNSLETTPLVMTLDQARALDALARAGSFAAAATSLGKRHSTVLYLLRTLEADLGIRLLDRSGYRTQLLPGGERVLEASRLLLAAEADAGRLIAQLQQGWEPRLGIVLDGIIPIAPVLTSVASLVGAKVPTKVDVRTEFLAGVEEAFAATRATLMIAVLPPRRTGLVAVDLPPIAASLVAARNHPLAKRRVSAAELAPHLLLTVRDSDPRLELSTADIPTRSSIQLNDFAAKRTAILAGLGYGWLPDYLITRELSRRELVRLNWSRASTHTFWPRLYHRGRVGPAATRVLTALTGVTGPRPHRVTRKQAT